MPLLGANVPN
jgi:hypothetical protein